jgi:putative membrane protein
VVEAIERRGKQRATDVDLIATSEPGQGRVAGRISTEVPRSAPAQATCFATCRDGLDTGCVERRVDRGSCRTLQQCDFRRKLVPSMLWIKAFHVIFVVTWFAGLFYLPRLFVYHVDAPDPISHDRFIVMERRLLAITHLGGALAVAFGLALLVWWVAHAPDYLRQGWLHGKLLLVGLLVAYHVSLVAMARNLRLGRNRRSARWFRIYNEVPALILVGVVILVVVKPF